MNGRFCTLVLFLTVLFFPHRSSAQTGTPQTIRGLIELGIEKNIGLQIERINIPIGDAEIIGEDAAFDVELFASTNYAENTSPLALASFLSPFDTSEEDQLSGEVGLRKDFRSGAQASIALSSEWVSDNNPTDGLDPRYRTALLLDLTQPLLRDFGTEINTTNLQLARNQRRQAALGYLFQAQSIALQIEQISVQLAGEAAVVDLQKDGVEFSTKLFNANQRKLDAGVIPISEVQEAETALAARQLRLSLAMQRRDQLFEELNRLLDHTLPQEFNASQLFQEPPTPVNLDLPDETNLFAAARKNRPDLQSSLIQIENFQLQERFSENQLKPQLDLQIQAGLNGLSGEERPGLTSNFTGNWTDSLGSAIERDGHQWGVGLEFSIPLGNRSAKSRYLRAGLEKKQANYQHRDLESALRSELKLQRLNLLRTIQQVGISERFTDLAIKTVKQEQRRLEEGLSDTFRMIIIQNEMIDAKVDRISSLVKYQQALAQMNFARGIILQQHGIDVKLDTKEQGRETL